MNAPECRVAGARLAAAPVGSAASIDDGLFADIDDHPPDAGVEFPIFADDDSRIPFGAQLGHHSWPDLMRSLAAITPRWPRASAAWCAAALAMLTPTVACDSAFLDPTFGGGDGYLLTDFADDDLVESRDEGYRVAVLGEELLAVGYASDRDGTEQGIALARYLQDGSLDPSFDGDGRRLVPFSRDELDGIHEAAFDPAGRIVVFGRAKLDFRDYPTVVRLLPDGSRDASFGGGDGVSVLVPGPSAVAMAIAPADGRIHLVASAPETDGGGGFVVQRLTPEGDIDLGFGDEGSATLRVQGHEVVLAIDLLIDHAGRLVLLGEVLAPGGQLFDLVFGRLLADGAPDASFGGGAATAVFPVLVDGGWWVGQLALQPDAKLLASAWDNAAGNQSAVMRVTASGERDGTFGVDGVARVSFGQDLYCTPVGLGVQADGKVFLYGNGQGYAGVAYNFVGAVRWDSAGVLDATFAQGGRLVWQPPGGDPFLHSHLFTDAGTVLIGGGSAPLSEDDDLMLIRLRP